MRIVYLSLALFTIFLVAGCSNNQDKVNVINKDSYDDARESAWNFVKEKGWDDTAKENWQHSKIKKTIAADDDHKFLGKAYKENYEGKEVLFVSFEGTPSILIDPNTNKVIGYKLLENPPLKGYSVDTKDIDKETVSSLQVGQKVVVKFDAFGLSAPMYAHATEIKIIEE